MSRVGMIALVTGVLAVATSYASAWLPGGTPTFGVWAMIVGCALIMSGMLALGSARSKVASSRVAALTVLLCLIILAGFGLPMLLPAETPESPLLLGLPLRMAIEIYGVGLFPALFLPLVFALEFRADGLDAASLEQLRVECDRLRLPAAEK